MGPQECAETWHTIRTGPREMSNRTPNAGGEGDEPQKPDDVAPQNVLYKDPNAAATAVKDSYDYWTGKITESSFALSLAVIGANWAVFGSVDRVLNNFWSELSIATVVTSLAISLLGAWKLGEMLRARAFYAEADRGRWRREFDENSGKETPWPFTKTIDGLGTFLRWTRTFLPVLGGVFFLLALFLDSSSHKQSSLDKVRASAATQQATLPSTPPYDKNREPRQSANQTP
jgi:hypothetical protein